MVPASFFNFLLTLIVMIEFPTPDYSFDKYDEPRLHMERLLKTNLVEFDLSLRLLIPLEGAGIKTLGDLVKQTRTSLRQIRNIGVAAVDKLATFLHKQGLSLFGE